jgi:hypothetical protein
MKEYRAEEEGGHAVHFLKRLTRASGASAELALRLYHDPQMLRWVLQSVRIPGGFHRVALSLHEDDAGPFVVASVQGRFVTCLAPGMSIRNLHLIPHAQLLAHMSRTEDNRERWAVAESVMRKGGGLDELVARLLKKGDDLTREEMIGLTALHPALKVHFLDWFLHAMLSAKRMGKALRQRKRLGKKDAGRLKNHWRLFWGAGHLALLSGMTGVRGLEAFFKDGSRPFVSHLIVLLYSGRPAMAARLAWFIGKMGTVFLPECKRMLLAPDLPEIWVLGLLGAVAIGLRHKKARHQVAKAVTRSFRAARDFPVTVQRLIVEAGDETILLGENVLGALHDPDMTHGLYLEYCKEDFIDYYQGIELPGEYTFHRPEEVPDDLALAQAANVMTSFHTHPDWLFHLVLMLPWLARCEAEDFYLAGDFYRHVRIPWRFEIGTGLIDDERKVWGKKVPVKVERAPGRNDPCPCGSGKKYKRCCLVESEARG